MPADSLHKWKHPHRFEITSSQSEKRTRQVIFLTLTTMIIEIAAGLAFGSMALLADGWHMATHAIALGITAFAYAFARRHADNPRYTFGTGKVSILGGFSSAVILGIIALLMAAESVQRLFRPTDILFNEAIFVAILGLAVNIASALLLMTRPHRSHRPQAADDHRHEDLNLKAAYLHVLADALTSLLAIIALLTGKSLGWIWMDPIMGIVGAFIITRWSYGLLRDTGWILLDRSADQTAVQAIRSALEIDPNTRVADLHLLRIGSQRLAVIASIVARYPKTPEFYKKLLDKFEDIGHVTIEVNPWDDAPG